MGYSIIDTPYRRSSESTLVRQLSDVRRSSYCFRHLDEVELQPIVPVHPLRFMKETDRVTELVETLLPSQQPGPAPGSAVERRQRVLLRRRRSPGCRAGDADVVRVGAARRDKFHHCHHGSKAPWRRSHATDREEAWVYHVRDGRRLASGRCRLEMIVAAPPVRQVL